MSYIPKLRDITDFLLEITRSERIAVGLFVTTSTALTLIFSGVEPWPSLPSYVEVGLSLVWFFSVTSISYVLFPKLWAKWRGYQTRKRQERASRTLSTLEKRLIARIGSSVGYVDLNRLIPRDFDCQSLIELRITSKALQEKGLVVPILSRTPNKLKITDRGLQKASEIHSEWKKNGDQAFIGD